MNLKQKVAIVTGSTSGIGEAIARRLAANGTHVVFNALSSNQKGQTLAAQFPNTIYQQADISEEKQCQRLVDTAIDQWGRLDILINNAVASMDVIPHPDLDAVRDEHFEKNFKTNMMGAWYLSRAAMPHLKNSGNGNIINISSLAGERPMGINIPYALSKAALNHLTRLLANVVGPEVRVNAIAPGLITTRRTAANHRELQKIYSDNTPLGKPGTIDDVASMAINILTTNNLTGQIIVLDSGLSLR